MAVIQVLAFFIVILYLSWRFGERIVDVLPAAVSLLVLLLYGLAFIGHMSFLDVINCVIAAAAVIFFLRQKKEEKKAFFAFCRKELLHPGCIVMVITIAAVSVLVMEKAVTWWDDYNFWAADVKSIFYLDGFAGKYCNVAAEFGDYPPGTQMMKWWFLHLSPSVFKEGLMFAGYYTMNLVYLMPLMRRLPGRNPVILLLMPVMLWLFPSVSEEFYLTGSCADLTMGVVYGAFLSGVLDGEGHGRLFYYGRLTLYLMVLVLLKNVGFIWAAFGILFLCGYRLLVWKREHTTVCGNVKSEVRAVLLTILLPVLTECSWLFFCLRMRRVAKLTGTAVNMAANGVQLPDYSGELIHTFLEAFFAWPLHRWKTLAIDLPPFALYVIICILTIVMYKAGRWDKTRARFGCLFFAVSGIIFYSINLISHLTIFAIEEQYLQPFGMVSSIERYGAPFMIGGMYVIGFLYLNRGNCKTSRYMPYIVCFIFVFAFADHKMAYEGLIGYRAGTQEILRSREEMLAGPASDFLTVIEDAEETKHIREKRGMRVLYLRDGQNASWVQNTYVGYEAAPVSVMYDNFIPEKYNGEMVLQGIAESHAGYLYVEEAGEGEQEVFADLVQKEKFCYNTLYKVERTQNGIILSAVK